jgi:rhodanese-related sulfurtransferase
MDFEISAGQVKAMLKQGETFTLLDVREPWELEKANLADTKNIPMGDVPSRANQELDPDQHIVVMCHHGVRSLSVTNWLRQQGFEKVQSMRGGIDGWARTVDPKIPLY